MLWLLGETVAVAVAPFVDDKPVLGLSLLPSVLNNNCKHQTTILNLPSRCFSSKACASA